MNRRTIINREDAFEEDAIRARDVLQTIASGLTTRGKRVSQYDTSEHPGFRKMKLAEAMAMAKRAADALNKAIAAFYESTPAPHDWDAYERVIKEGGVPDESIAPKLSMSFGQMKDVPWPPPAPAKPAVAAADVVKEPDDFKTWPAENCADCNRPTRTWLPDGHTPLCEVCAGIRRTKPKTDVAGDLLAPVATVNWTLDMAKRFKKAHKKAAELKRNGGPNSFGFDNNMYLIAYAAYLIQFLETKFKEL